MTLKTSLEKIVKAFRVPTSKLQTRMDTFPFACLSVLAVVTGLSLASGLQLTAKLFIIGYSTVVISLTFIIYKFCFRRE
jgi:hypothetical protein